MKPVLHIILISYAMIFAPGCKNVNLGNQTQVKSSASKKTKGLSNSQKKSLEESRKKILKLFESQKIIAQDEKGNILSAEQALKSLGSSKNNLFLVDNSKFESSKVMMQLKITHGFLGSGNKFIKADEASLITHISFSASLWERNVDKSKGEYLATSRKLSPVSTDKSENMKNMKAAVSELASDLTAQSRNVIANYVLENSKATILSMVVIMISCLLIALLFSKPGKGFINFGVPGLAQHLSLYMAYLSAAIALVAGFAHYAASVFGKIPPEKALPEFDF